jgi:hypothetical protein
MDECVARLLLEFSRELQKIRASFSNVDQCTVFSKQNNLFFEPLKTLLAEFDALCSKTTAYSANSAPLTDVVTVMNAQWSCNYFPWLSRFSTLVKSPHSLDRLIRNKPYAVLLQFSNTKKLTHYVLSFKPLCTYNHVKRNWVVDTHGLSDILAPIKAAVKLSKPCTAMCGSQELFGHPNMVDLHSGLSRKVCKTCAYPVDLHKKGAVNPTIRSKQTISKALRAQVWGVYLGLKNGQAPCFCCEKTMINQFEFQCGHVVAEARGGETTVENLRPICGLCNQSMGTANLFEFKKQFKFFKN